MKERETSLPVRLLSSLEDEPLIALCLVGSEAAWRVLIQRYASLIYSVARRLGLREHDAEDVFQEVAILLCDNLEAVRDQKRLAGWLATATRRVVYRRAQRRSSIAFSELTHSDSGEDWLERAGPVAESPEHQVLALEQHWQLHRCLDKLPERCRTLLTLLYVQCPAASYQEVEQRLGIAVNSISPTRARCLQKLKLLLEQCDREPKT